MWFLCIWYARRGGEGILLRRDATPSPLTLLEPLGNIVEAHCEIQKQFIGDQGARPGKPSFTYVLVS